MSRTTTKERQWANRNGATCYKAIETIGCCTLYHADCLDVLPNLSGFDSVITDPVWPNAIDELQGASDPYGLFEAAARYFPEIAERVVVHLGCDSDPSILRPLAEKMNFLRTCWMRYAFPHPKGRILYSGDVAYVYGRPPKSRKGAHVMPGETTAAKKDLKYGHPCPRKYEHVKWLYNFYAGKSSVDPFMGSGTTAAAAATFGVDYVGVEIDKRFFDMACERAERAWKERPRLFQSGQARGTQIALAL